MTKEISTEKLEEAMTFLKESFPGHGLILTVCLDGEAGTISNIKNQNEVASVLLHALIEVGQHGDMLESFLKSRAEKH